MRWSEGELAGSSLRGAVVRTSNAMVGVANEHRQAVAISLWYNDKRHLSSV
jgi:hypothetical protein